MDFFLIAWSTQEDTYPVGLYFRGVHALCIAEFQDPVSLFASVL